jgi:phosphate transport system substrate-binding protein
LSRATARLYRCILAVAAGLLVPQAHAQLGRDYVYIVGSSTVYPLSTIVAERFGRSTGFRAPKVESTGSGGGFKLFCDGIGTEFPDINSASRRIKRSEIARCVENGVSDIVEIKIGYDGIVFAHVLDTPVVALTRKDIYLALAKETPTPDGEALEPNPNRYWSDVRSDLPHFRIEVLGPPTTSGTRDEFVELAMEDGCRKFDSLRQLEQSNPGRFMAVCRTLREDGAYVEAGENDNVIVHKLQAKPKAFGIFGFSHLDQNTDKLKAATIDEIAPTFDAIATLQYPLSRPLYFYVKKDHVPMIPGLREFLEELTSERALGEDGYLVDRGLVPLAVTERRLEAENAAALGELSIANK